MITGIGTDMIEVARVAEKIGKDSGFTELVFSADEIKYCEAKAYKYQHYAARFAAKEAFLKAIGSGWDSGINLYEIEIVNDEKGKPSLQINGDTGLTLQAFANSNIWVSLSHLKDIASAVVVIESNK